MLEAQGIVMVGAIALAGLAIAIFAALKGWQGWLDVRRLEIARSVGESVGPAGDRIELADLRERVRKLEAIAAGIDL